MSIIHTVADFDAGDDVLLLRPDGIVGGRRRDAEAGWFRQFGRVQASDGVGKVVLRVYTTEARRVEAVRVLDDRRVREPSDEVVPSASNEARHERNAAPGRGAPELRVREEAERHRDEHQLYAAKHA